MISHLVTSAALAFMAFTAFARADIQEVTFFFDPHCLKEDTYYTFSSLDIPFRKLSDLQGDDGCSPPNISLPYVFHSIRMSGLPNSRIFGWVFDLGTTKPDLIPGTQNWTAPLPPSTKRSLVSRDSNCNETGMPDKVGITYIQMFTGDCPPK